MDQTPEQSPTPASAEDFRSARAHPLVVKLPASGLVVQLRRISLWELTAAGRIPDELTTLTLTNLGEDIEEAKAEHHSPSASRTMLRRRIELMDAVAIAVLEAPPMTHDGAGESLRPEDLSLEDRIYIFSVASGTAEVHNLARFPDGSGAGLAPVAHGGALRAEAEQPAGG